MKIKKIILLLSLIGISSTTWSQEPNTAEKKHELRIDALEMLVYPGLDITYEYVLNEYSGVGAAVNFRLDPPEDDYEAFTFAPYYRQYFFQNKYFGSKGFYIEGLMQYTSGKTEKETQISNVENYNDLGVGFGGGVKWITNNGFIIDLGGDIGRNFKFDEESNDVFFRWGISLGYRFF